MPSDRHEAARPSTRDATPRRFELELSIAAPRDAVWRAIADDAELVRWFAPQAEIDAREGGEIVWRWSDFFTWRQRVEVCEPGRRLLTRYESGVDDGAGGKRPLFVEFLLSGEGGSTTLRLVHSGFGAEAGFDEEYDGVSQGWPVELGVLRLYLERHRGAERRLAWAHATLSLSPAEAWSRLVGPQGFDCGAAAERAKPGERFVLRAPDERIECDVLQRTPRELTGVARSHEDGFARLWVGSVGGVTHAWAWLATWGEAPARVEARQARFDALLSAVYPERVELAPGARERS